jgi:hypothetical protein
MLSSLSHPMPVSSARLPAALACLLFASISWLGAACSDDGGDGSAPQLPPAELGCKAPVAGEGGFEVCANGVLHRREVLACPDARADNVKCGGTGEPGTPDGPTTCTRADCRAVESPVCVSHVSGAYFPPTCECHGNCLADTDCGAGAICACNGTTGACVPAGCASDAECNGGACLQVVVLATSSCGSATTTFACTTPDDTCDDDADCGRAPGVACRLDGAVRRCARLPTPCCTGGQCGTTCWDATDCGGAACIEASDGFCSGITPADGPPRIGRCQAPDGTCVSDADCNGNPKGAACVWDGKRHTCGNVASCQPA